MSISAQLIPIHYYPNSANWLVQIRHLELPIWLDSGHPQSSYGRFDILSAAPAISLSTSGGITCITQDGLSERSHENPFMVLQRHLPPLQTSLEQVPFCGGALGYFGYDLGRSLEKLPEAALKDIGLPDMRP
jgi:para-aminobenzoate synthetase component 1